MHRSVRSATGSLRALAAAGGCLAASTALADFNFNVGKPGQDGTVTYKIGGVEYPVEVKKGWEPTKKAEEVAKKLRENFGEKAIETKGATIIVRGKYDSSSITRKGDTTLQKDVVGGSPITEYAMLGILEPDDSAFASGTTLDEAGNVVSGSWFRFGVESLHVAEIYVTGGESTESVIAAVYDDLKNNPLSPQLLRDATSFADGRVTVDLSQIYDPAFGFTIENTDLGLAGTESMTVQFSAVPTPASAALLGLGALAAARRRR